MRKEVKPEECSPRQTVNQAPIGHTTSGRSPDDPSMAFEVPDCGIKAGGEFMTPFVIDTRDLPTPEASIKNKQGF